MQGLLLKLKCLVAAAMDNASTSHCNHVVCEPCSLALKKPERCSFPLRGTKGGTYTRLADGSVSHNPELICWSGEGNGANGATGFQQ